MSCATRFKMTTARPCCIHAAEPWPHSHSTVDANLIWGRMFTRQHFLHWRIILPASTFKPCGNIKMKWEPTMMSPIGLWAAVLKPRVWHFVRRHLGLLKPEVNIFRGALTYTCNLHPLEGTICQSHRVRPKRHNMLYHIEIQWEVRSFSHRLSFATVGITLCWSFERIQISMFSLFHIKGS